ncbi:hypothetical protein C8D72_3466 [Kushneria indalinina DSM 14324]|uniref:Uncharacterized protein n=1 Tax=Kushneria indalinina DSM 14324 TaxID=1122140 RepID=A0A3D9DRI0_9GAMM|nr:hypothetical protein C8D72_3466 [Kushneria indalinina DSM 14324]
MFYVAAGFFALMTYSCFANSNYVTGSFFAFALMSSVINFIRRRVGF